MNEGEGSVLLAAAAAITRPQHGFWKSPDKNGQSCDTASAELCIQNVRSPFFKILKLPQVLLNVEPEVKAIVVASTMALDKRIRQELKKQF